MFMRCITITKRVQVSLSLHPKNPVKSRLSSDLRGLFLTTFTSLICGLNTGFLNFLSKMLAKKLSRFLYQNLYTYFLIMYQNLYIYYIVIYRLRVKKLSPDILYRYFLASSRVKRESPNLSHANRGALHAPIH